MSDVVTGTAGTGTASGGIARAVPVAVLVVDDERLARERLRRLLAAEPGVTVVGECANGLEALAAITAPAGTRPELVFLDVQMPDLDGLAVVDALGPAQCPELVFVTAHAEYMERAFEVHAVDYLRKPYTTARFAAALAIARRRVLAGRHESAVRGGRAAYADVLAAVAPERADPRLAVRDGTNGSWHIVRRDDVTHVVADGSGHACAVHVVGTHPGRMPFTWRRSLNEIERELAPHGFLRVHRSVLVNGAHIRTVKPLLRGEYALLLTGNALVDTGRTHRATVEQFVAGRALGDARWPATR